MILDNKRNKLSNQVVIVTGGAGAMGAAIATLLAREGANVVISDIDGEKAQNIAEIINSEGHTAIGVKTDVTNEQDVSTLIHTTLDRFETIHGLVNSAGVLRGTRIESISKDEWDFVLDVNLNGTFLCAKAVIPAMKKNNYGRIVNLASLAGRSVSNLGGAHYTASKAGVIGFTRALAKELGPLGITSNAICPGVVDSEMAKSIASPDQLQTVVSNTPIPRLALPDEIANLVLFIIADAPYINGASIDINGGGLMI